LFQGQGLSGGESCIRSGKVTTPHGTSDDGFGSGESAFNGCPIQRFIADHPVMHIHLFLISARHFNLVDFV
jgi:hypothetical protein